MSLHLPDIVTPALACARPSARHRRAGMTLIEVLTGMVILGTVLASMAVARGRFLRQWAAADTKVDAAAALDLMLANWVDTPSGQLPVPAQGPLAGTHNCLWRTRWVTSPAAAALNASVVRVDVLQQSPRGGEGTPLLAVEFLVHSDPARRAAPTTRGAR